MSTTGSCDVSVHYGLQHTLIPLNICTLPALRTIYSLAHDLLPTRRGPYCASHKTRQLLLQMFLGELDMSVPTQRATSVLLNASESTWLPELVSEVTFVIATHLGDADSRGSLRRGVGGCETRLWCRGGLDGEASREVGITST